VRAGLISMVAAAIAFGVGAAPAAALPTAPWQPHECLPTAPGEARTSASCGATLVNGRAIPPPSAPPVVQAVIKAANHIDGRPYVWGGGHAGFSARGYDCSGAVSYVLHAGGLLETTMVSGQLAYWGDPGSGRWITVYANSNHVYMVIAGLRFDTRDDLPGVSGPRWHREMANPKRFAVRHPAGF
jgi:hypothetical protein